MAKEQFEIYFFGSGTVEAFSFTFGWMREDHTEEPMGIAEFLENNKEALDDSSVAVGTGGGVSS